MTSTYPADCSTTPGMHTTAPWTSCSPAPTTCSAPTAASSASRSEPSACSGPGHDCDPSPGPARPRHSPPRRSLVGRRPTVGADGGFCVHWSAFKHMAFVRRGVPARLAVPLRIVDLGSRISSQPEADASRALRSRRSRVHRRRRPRRSRTSTSSCPSRTASPCGRTARTLVISEPGVRAHPLRLGVDHGDRPGVETGWPRVHHRARRGATSTTFRTAGASTRTGCARSRRGRASNSARRSRTSRPVPARPARSPRLRGGQPVERTGATRSVCSASRPDYPRRAHGGGPGLTIGLGEPRRWDRANVPLPPALPRRRRRARHASRRGGR